MDLNSLNVILGIIGGIVSILAGVFTLTQFLKKPAQPATESGPTSVPERNTRTGGTHVPAPSVPVPPPATTGPAIPGVAEFSGDDAAYHAWITAHPTGFVINTPRRKVDPNYMALHRATCPFVSNFAGTEPGAYTERDYRKVCANSLEPLRTWARANGRPDGSFTGNCNCKPLAG